MSGHWNFRDPYGEDKTVRPSNVSGMEMTVRNSRANSLNFATYEAREKAKAAAANAVRKAAANAAAQKALRNRMSQTAYGQAYLTRYGPPTRKAQRGGRRYRKQTRKNNKNRRHQK